MKICFLVVIYNKSIEESTTLKGLLKLLNSNFNCLVVNNGPKKITPLNLKNFDFIEYLDNKPLSIIYNDFIKNYEADRYVILDDDSILCESFIERVFSKNLDLFDLELPKVFDKNNKLFYPLRNWYPIKENEYCLNYREDFIFSIGSGLVITKNLVNHFKIKNINLFNEAFALYGVDFSLFWELRKNNFDNLKITSVSKIIHDMSLHGDISDFKRNELYMNFALQMRYYPNIVNLKNFIYSLLQLIKKNKLKEVLMMIKVYILAKHPKC